MGERPWWRRWDGLPPSMERRLERSWERRANATGWRRWFGGTWLHVLGPLCLGVAQVAELADGDQSGPVLVWRLAVLGVAVVGVVGSSVAAIELRRDRLARETSEGAAS